MSILMFAILIKLLQNDGKTQQKIASPVVASEK